MNIYLDLFLTFAKIGLFTFGGGYAMIAVIEHNCVEKKNWITHDELMNMTVVAESTPGPIAINCATYTGYRKAGFLGALMTTTGVVLPSFFVICLISVFLDHFLEIAIVANAFQGIKIAVGILILNAAITMIRKMKKKKFQLGVIFCATIAMLCINLFALNFSTISLMLVAGFVSLAIFSVQQKGGDRK